MPPTVCWFIQSHRNPDQVLRLVRLLRGGSVGPIVITHDPRGETLDADAFHSLGNVHLVPPPAPPIRGTFNGQLAPYLHVLEWLERKGTAYDWLINITGQDYPVTPVAEIEAFLDRADCDGFVRHWEVLSEKSPWSRRKARARYWYHYRRFPESTSGALRAMRWITKIAPLHFYLDYGPLVGMRRLGTPFDDSMPCRGGWAFWTLSRKAVRYLRATLAERPDLLRHYRRCIAPEESLVQTILGAATSLRIVNGDLRYIDYSMARRGSPRTITAEDVPLFRNGGFHFARKFDPDVDSEVLDRIDQEIHGMR